MSYYIAQTLYLGRGLVMARTPRDVTEAELAIMQVLWDTGPAAIRLIAEKLYPPGSVAHYATVQKLLERLESKRCVARDRRSAVHVFSAAVSRDELIGRRLRAVADTLCGGSLTPLLSHLVRTTRLSARQRQELREWLEEQSQNTRPPNSR
jgi:predicted transcriptional regulator